MHVLVAACVVHFGGEKLYSTMSLDSMWLSSSRVRACKLVIDELSLTMFSFVFFFSFFFLNSCWHLKFQKSPFSC